MFTLSNLRFLAITLTYWPLLFKTVKILINQFIRKKKKKEPLQTFQGSGKTGSMSNLFFLSPKDGGMCSHSAHPHHHHLGRDPEVWEGKNTN